jgi:ankyrin repeat protein
MINTDFNLELDKLHTITNKIFQLIKLQDWKNLKKIINDNNIDYNIKDNSNTWLLEYLILFNQLEIIKLLLTKNIRLDITDENNHSILYSIIKFSYIPILKLLLEKDKEIIGKSILEIKDNEDNIPLFYAIKFFNLEAIDIILKYQNNFYSKNIEGENALHISVKTMNLEIFKIVLTKISDINIRKNNGETCLHLAIKYKSYDIIKYIIQHYIDKDSNINLNLTESKYNFSCLHYIFLSLDPQLVLIFKNNLNKFNPNIQDKSGNIFLHYFINNIIQNENQLKNEDVLFMIDEIKKLKINYNLYNVDRNMPCHILLLNLDKIKNKYNIIINDFIEKSDLNIQNINGESCLFLLVKNNYWQDVKNILIKKKLDIFIIDQNKNIIFDYLDSEDFSKFSELITNSYLYILSNTDYNKKWLDYWDNRCKKNINLEELNETEKDLIQNIQLDKNKSLCFNLINDKIKNYISTFKKNKKIYDIHSYPIHTKYPKLIDNYPDVVVPSFSGSTIDIISGLIYLNNKYIKNITTSLKLVDSNSSILNCKNNICEITGFEILWKNYQFIMPANKTNELMRELTYIKINKNVRFFIIPIGIELNTNEYSYGHANILIFDFATMQVERFEPHGSEAPYGLDYDAHLLDNILENKIDSFKLGFQYVSPYEYLPKIGFQIKEISELKSDYIGDPNGFCAVWCVWWTDIRINNPSIPRKKLVSLLSKEIINEEYSYKKLIRNYSFYITEVRDKILTKVGININDWLNDTINNEQKLLLEQTLKNEITKLTN